MHWVARIERHSIDADCVVEAALLDAFLAALMAMCAQGLQFAAPEFDWIVMVRHDVIGDFGRDDAAFAQAPFAQWLALQLTACATMP